MMVTQCVIPKLPVGEVVHQNDGHATLLSHNQFIMTPPRYHGHFFDILRPIYFVLRHKRINSTSLIRPHIYGRINGVPLSCFMKLDD